MASYKPAKTTIKALPIVASMHISKMGWQKNELETFKRRQEPCSFLQYTSGLACYQWPCGLMHFAQPMNCATLHLCWINNRHQSNFSPTSLLNSDISIPPVVQPTSWTTNCKEGKLYKNAIVFFDTIPTRNG